MKDKGSVFDLRLRTKQYALRIIKLFGALPKNFKAQLIGKQLIRSGTSVGAHYREATRGRSTREFISKIETALQELEETRYWLELLVESDTFSTQRMQKMFQETDELNAILTVCVKNAKKR